MSITISGRHIEITDSVREYAEERVERLFRFYERINKVQMVLGSKGPKYSAELVVSAPKGLHLVAEATEDGLNAAVDIVIDKMERQITKHKEKLLDHRRDSGRLATAGAQISGEDEGDVEEPGPEGE